MRSDFSLNCVTVAYKFRKWIFSIRAILTAGTPSTSSSIGFIFVIFNCVFWRTDQSGNLAVALGLDMSMHPKRGHHYVGASGDMTTRRGHPPRREHPHVLATSPGTVAEHRQKKHPTARLLGAAAAGFSELLLFHPVDTVAKRLMSNQTASIKGRSQTEAISTLNKVIFREAATKTTFGKYFSLFPGLGFGAGYKVFQRAYKFGGQPFVKDYIANNHSGRFQRAFGERRAKLMMEATAGSIIGVGEIVLLPLDILKIKAQTAPETLSGRGIVDIFFKEWRELYRGAGWTAVRNAPGSFALFGGASAVKEYVFELDRQEGSTLFQTFCASIVGAVASITVAAPLDVVKTRIHNRPFDSPESGMSIVRRLLSNEGPGAFFKGLAPKIIVVGPKLVFSFTVAQQLICFLEGSLNNKSHNACNNAPSQSTVAPVAKGKAAA